MLRINGGTLENVVKEGYGQDMHLDVKVLKYNGEKHAFEGRVWNGNFGPGDNTTWLEVQFAAVVERFGAETAAELAA